MDFLENLRKDLDRYSLLQTTFYRDWQCGNLSLSVLRIYAKEYYPHVAHFPRYLSCIHSQCNDIAWRQLLLSNLLDEEQGEDNHPELWLRFSESIGCSRKEIMENKENDLSRKYFDIMKSGFCKGLGALYAYERQTPEVSVTKMEGLRKFYGIQDAVSLGFFEVHKEADVWHSQECESIINQMDLKSFEMVKEGAIAGAKLLVGFLDEMSGHQAACLN